MLKTTLAALIILGTFSGAFASEFDGNLGNRYPQATIHVMTTSNVALPQQAPKAVSGNWMDHASQSFSGGY